MNEQKDETLSGTIKRVVFQNRENGYAVLKTVDGNTLCGTLPDPSANLGEADFTATGRWRKHKKYGPQFEFQELTIDESDLFYFLSRIVKGIGRKMAHHLLGIYDEEALITILDERPQELLRVKGIKHKKLARIRESWEKFKDLRELSELLIPHGATPALVVRIYRHYLEDGDAVGRIRENPYLITEVKGIGFKTADRLALHAGLRPDSPYRIRSCILYTLGNYTADEGNSCISVSRLRELVDRELAVDTSPEGAESGGDPISGESFRGAVEELIADHGLVRLEGAGAAEEPGSVDPAFDEWVTSSSLYRAETHLLETAQAKGRLREARIVDNIEAFIGVEEEALGISFSEEQKRAIAAINDGASFFILCGYAGTGKSTVSRGILDLLARRYGPDSLACCALSGIAADRIRKLSGYEAHTIQSLLVKHLRGERLPYRVLLMDEASMVNSELFHRLFSVMRKDCVIVLVGDPAQLPPIGAGNPFHDLIESAAAPTVTLTRIYRQSRDRVLTTFADHIRKAAVPPEFRGRYEDFRFVDISIDNYFARIKSISAGEKRALREENSRLIVEEISRLAAERRAELGRLFQARNLSGFIGHFQLITPVRGGMLGADNLNEILQSILNPRSQEGHGIALGRVALHLYDRVVHIVNQDMDCYEPAAFRLRKNSAVSSKQRIYNGMIGILFQIDRGEELLWVYYPADRIVVEYGFDDARELLRLSYALTIHKTQGSEFQNVVIPMSFSHFIMLNNKLLYTAVTRAKGSCTVVGESYAFASACRRKDVTVRDTVMMRKLKSG